MQSNQAQSRKRDKFTFGWRLGPTEKGEGNALAEGIFQIVVGLVAIGFGFSAGEFYPAFIRRPRPDEKPAPKWLGRTIWAVVGVGFILSGLADLRHH